MTAVSLLRRSPAVLGELWQSLAPPPAWIFAGRTVLAVMLALYLAYELELDNAFSAGVTVLIVSHPVHGMVWSKSLYRTAGTLAGGVMAILLTALFAQSPELFLLAFSLWLGLCVAASTLLRQFRSYGAVLAGYTVVLIVFPGLPEAASNIFTLVTTRVSAVLLGIACSALVGSLMTRRNSGRQLERKLRDTLAALTRHVRQALTAGALAGMPQQRQRLRAEITAVEALVEFAEAEGTEIAGRADSLRIAVVAMLATLTAAAAAQDALSTAGQNRPLVALVAALSARLDDLSAILAGDATPVAALDIALADLTTLQRRIEDSLEFGDFPALRAFDRLDDLLDDLTIAIGGLTGLRRRQSGRARVRLSFHVEGRWALVNGLRAALSVWLAGALWVYTAWPAGGMLLGAVVPNVALLSLRERPDRDALEFVKGIALAILVALLCLLFVLPRLTGFPLLALTLGVILFWGVVQTTRPPRAFLGLGFLVFFLTLLAPANAMRYDIAAFLNNGLAVLSGALLTAIVHRLVLPVDPRRQVRALLADIRSDLQRLPGRRQPLAAEVWETRMHDRLLRLATRLRRADMAGEDLLRGTHAALRMGREIIRLRQLLDGLTALPEAAKPGAVALRALGRLSIDPRRTVRLCRQVAGRLLRSAAGQPPEIAASLGKAATSLVEIALLLGRHRRFFRLSGKEIRRC